MSPGISKRLEHRAAGGESSRRSPRETVALVCATLAGVWIVAGGLVAAVASAAPFDRGAWLAAYLVLVGGAAQLALGFGRARLGLPEPSVALARAELALWNAGVVAVPAGVLASAPAAVTLGSVSLLAALALFARPAAARFVAARSLPYLALVLALAASVVVGSALAGAPPGAW